MKFFQWLDALNLDLEISRKHNEANFIVKIPDIYVRDTPDSTMNTVFGKGTTLVAAVTDFYTKLEGRFLIINFMSSNRSDWEIPKFNGIGGLS